jgi:hypothetical protein
MIPSGIRIAQRVPGDRVLLLRADLTLAVVDPSGDETTIARAAFGPRLSVDGERVVYLQLPDGTVDPQTAQRGTLVLYDLRAGTGRTVSDDPDALYG